MVHRSTADATKYTFGRRTTCSMKRISLTLIWEFKVVFLYFRNLLAVQSLEVGPVGLRNESRYDRPRSTVHWEAHGCHRIEVVGYGTYPGNIKGVSILAPPSDCKIHIVFQGVNNRADRTVLLHAYNKELLRQFAAHPKTPELVASNFHLNNLENDFTRISIACAFFGQDIHVDLKGS